MSQSVNCWKAAWGLFSTCQDFAIFCDILRTVLPILSCAPKVRGGSQECQIADRPSDQHPLPSSLQAAWSQRTGNRDTHGMRTQWLLLTLAEPVCWSQVPRWKFASLSWQQRIRGREAAWQRARKCGKARRNFEHSRISHCTKVRKCASRGTASRTCVCVFDGACWYFMAAFVASLSLYLSRSID